MVQSNTMNIVQSNTVTIAQSDTINIVRYNRYYGNTVNMVQSHTIAIVRYNRYRTVRHSKYDAVRDNYLFVLSFNLFTIIHCLSSLK